MKLSSFSRRLQAEEYQVQVGNAASAKVGAEPKYTLTVEKAAFAQESTAKEQLKVSEHSAKFKADKVYLISVKSTSKGFTPSFLILDGDKVVARGGTPSGSGMVFRIGPGGGLQIDTGRSEAAPGSFFIPERSASYRILVNAAVNDKPGKGAMDYTLKVVQAKTELVVRDELTADDALYAARKSHHKVHTVKLQADKTYQIDLRSAAFDAYLYLEESAQKVLKEDDDSGGGLNARIIFRPTKTDTYRLIATSYGPKGEGAYSLSVIENPDAQPAEAPGIRAVPVPPNVRESFAAKFPGAAKVEWKLKKDKNYEAEFKLKDVVIAAIFDPKGKWVETETTIEEAELTKEVRAAIAKDFKGYKIIETQKVKRADDTRVSWKCTSKTPTR